VSELVDLSIVVVNWNARAWLERCLATVFADADRSPFRIEVIVVDNASADGSTEMVRRCFPAARLIENPDNLGFAAANNLGIRAASGRFVMLLNPDTELQAGALQTLVEHAEARPDVGAAGPKLIGSRGTLEASCTRFPTLARELAHLFHLGGVLPTTAYRMDRWDPAESRRVDVIQGACMLLRRSALDQIGLLDEDYFMYSEEVDLCHRLVRAGWTISWVGAAVVVHHGGQSTRQVPLAMFLELYRSKVLFFRKCRGRLGAAGFKLILGAASLARLMLAPIAFLEPERARQRHLELVGRYAHLARKLWKF
jgi:N-acetylglucosaminyl-diphospho-decaprenol L-rhamnosyltransferase